MTREDILAMPAGKELDKLVAKKVMEWIGPTDETMYLPAQWLDSDRKPIRNVTWSPSTNISSAWEVVEKVLSDIKRVSLFKMPGGNWSCKISDDVAYADTAQLAICHSALIAVMEVTP